MEDNTLKEALEMIKRSGLDYTKKYNEAGIDAILAHESYDLAYLNRLDQDYLLGKSKKVLKRVQNNGLAKVECECPNDIWRGIYFGIFSQEDLKNADNIYQMNKANGN